MLAIHANCIFIYVTQTHNLWIIPNCLLTYAVHTSLFLLHCFLGRAFLIQDRETRRCPILFTTDDSTRTSLQPYHTPPVNCLLSFLLPVLVHTITAALSFPTHLIRFIPALSNLSSLLTSCFSDTYVFHGISGLRQSGIQHI